MRTCAAINISSPSITQLGCILTITYVYPWQRDTVEPVLSNKTKLLKKNGSLMKVERPFDLYNAIIGLENKFGLLFEWPL